MAETKTLEEAWDALWKGIADEVWENIEDAARALALAGLEEARSKADTRQHGSMRGRQIRFGKLRRRIEELGR